MMAFGFGTHLVGIFADASMALRGYSKEESFKKGALIFVSLYTVAFLIWFIWIQVLTFGQLGKVCSGYYLADPTVQVNYAVRQGQVFKNLIIGVYCANGFIVVLSIVSGFVLKAKYGL